jgi:hypothetical protein
LTTDIVKRIVTLFAFGLTDREQLKNKVLAMSPLRKRTDGFSVSE